ncbi:concanavalin A-like lectin/glucanase domain-containing protein [Obelidium mucronatum]|nr:concanavalin A-like lectin/glucanase domain-containing protein [Obelidium mucronatum]
MLLGLTVFAVLAPLAKGQELFKGSSCNLNIPKFNGPNSALTTGGTIAYENGQLIMAVTPPANKSDITQTGLGSIATTNLALLYGTIEATIQQSTIGGVVTYLTLINQNTKDELDLEWIGNERETVWTNMFYRGRREREAVTLNEIWSKQVPASPDNSVTAHIYRIDWTPESITWWVDGTMSRVLRKSDTFEAAGTGDQLPYDHYHYPNTPMTINLGIWNSQDKIWANGPIDWTNPAYSQGLSARFSSLKVACYEGAVPTVTDPLIVPSLTVTIFDDGSHGKTPATTHTASSKETPSTIAKSKSSTPQASVSTSPTATTTTSESATVAPKPPPTSTAATRSSSIRHILNFAFMCILALFL